MRFIGYIFRLIHNHHSKCQSFCYHKKSYDDLTLVGHFANI